MPSTVHKDVIRERMTQTGEKYTEARRAVIAEREAERNVPLLRELMQPGQVVAVVCGGGMTNWAFALPGLLAAVDDGRPVTIAQDPRAHDVWAPGSILDIVGARGLAGPARIAKLKRDGNSAELGSLAAEAAKGIRSINGPAYMQTWRDELAAAERPPVVFVRDIQTGGPIADRPLVRNGLSQYDQIPHQVAALRELARHTGATFIAGHAMPHDFPEGWRDLVDNCDQAIVIDSEYSEDGLSNATLSRYVRDLHVGDIAAKIDHHPMRWRDALRPH